MNTNDVSNEKKAHNPLTVDRNTFRSILRSLNEEHLSWYIDTDGCLIIIPKKVVDKD